MLRLVKSHRVPNWNARQEKCSAALPTTDTDTDTKRILSHERQMGRGSMPSADESVTITGSNGTKRPFEFVNKLTHQLVFPSKPLSFTNEFDPSRLEAIDLQRYGYPPLRSTFQTLGFPIPPAYRLM
jgi:hypothetical protein